jgi:hypothetical protein
MTSPLVFNESFGNVASTALVKFIQRIDGCFFCSKPGATAQCSKCKFAVFCGRDCQARDWKGPNRKHCKDGCGIYLDNLKAGECVEVCIKSICLLSQDDFVDAMELRRKLLWLELQRVNVTTIHFQISVVGFMHGIYLLGATSFWSGEVHMVNRIIAIPLVPGEDVPGGVENNVDVQRAKRPLHMGSGTILKQMQKKVIEQVITVIKGAKEAGIKKIASITVGRGLMSFANDESDFRKSLKHNGIGLGIGVIPSTDYLLIDSAQTAMRRAGIM